MPEIGKYARLSLDGTEARYALVTDDRAEILDAAPWHGGRSTGETIVTSAARLLCPVEPSKILGIGKNYRAHASEMGGGVPSEPLVFAKLASSLVGPGATVLLPKESARVDYEGELGVVIGRRARRVPFREALDYVFGYTVLCDVTARDLQQRDGQWTRAKGFDTFCPVGPFVVRGIDASALDISLTIDGKPRQQGNTRDMVFDVAALVTHLSAFTTLEPGDLVATGTPEGVGPLEHGNRVTVSISGIGAFDFQVAREPGTV